VRFETTYDEIVDVAVEGAPGASVAACLADAAWALRLDAEFHAAHDRIDVPIQVRAAAPTSAR
jgi:hypothetical protein